jgi:hypothetical protein
MDSGEHSAVLTIKAEFWIGVANIGKCAADNAGNIDITLCRYLTGDKYQASLSKRATATPNAIAATAMKIATSLLRSRPAGTARAKTS